VLAEQAPDLHQALERAHAGGLPHVILDGKIIPCDRCKEPAVSAHAFPALYPAAGLPTLADPGYDGAGIGVVIPVKQP